MADIDYLDDVIAKMALLGPAEVDYGGGEDGELTIECASDAIYAHTMSRVGSAVYVVQMARYALHLLARLQLTQEGGGAGASGPLTSARTGNIAVSYGGPGGSGSGGSGGDDDLGTTVWGKMYRSTSKRRSGPRLV